MKTRRLDDGAPGFDPSNLEVTSVDVGNAAHNVVPQRAVAKLNINGLHLWARDTDGREYANFYAMYKLNIAP